MIFRLYNLLFPVAFLLMLPGYLRRMVRRGNYRAHFGQRFGLYSRADRLRLTGCQAPIWVQAVSVGEMLVALKLVAALRQRQPGRPLVLSTTTTTGFALARERVGAEVPVIYTPIDLRGAVRRAFDLLQPAAVVIVDGGLWPNQLLEARRRGIPATLANARLSPRSERRFRRFGWISRHLFGLLDRVCVPETADLARWQSLGVPTERIVVTGSVKYDDPAPSTGQPADGDPGTPRALLRRLGVGDTAPVLFGGSTHAGEERMLAEVFLQLRGRCPDLRLVLAPRHAERTPEILRALAPLGLRIVRRTATLASAPAAPPEGAPDLFLLDTTGELRAWYSVATLVVIGKSFAVTGGQNPAEAIAAGKPVLFGPHMENFGSLVAQLLAAGGAVQVNDAPGLRESAAVLLHDDAARQGMAARARALLHTHEGAAARTADLLPLAP